MARRNGYMMTVHQLVVQARATHTQMCLDAAMLAANEEFHMGPTRAEGFAASFSEALMEIATMTADDDGGIVVIKQRLDERLQKICGNKFQPWDVRYDGAKDIIHDAAVTRLQQRVQELKRENEKLREKLYGTH